MSAYHCRTYIGKEPFDACKCFDKTSMKKRDTETPHSIAVYNKFMGDVGKADMLLSLYHTKYWSRKWYHHIGFHLFSLGAINSWLVYQQMGGSGALLKFLQKICISLIKDTTQQADPNQLPYQLEYRSLKATDVPDDIKEDKVNHWPMLMNVPNS